MRQKKPTPGAARQSIRRLDQKFYDLRIPTVPKAGWVRAIRVALGMTQSQLARRMGIAQQNAASLETDELLGNITLSRLTRAADALGCELNYQLVPRQPLSKIISEQAVRRAEKKFGRINESQALEAAAMSAESLAIVVADLAKEMEINRAADLWDE